MKFIIPLLVASLPVAAVAQSQSAQAAGAPGAALPKTTEVMVIVTAKQDVTRQQIMAVMPTEIRETVKLYLDGKIHQWFSRGDGKAVILLIEAKTEDEARAVMETLPLSKEHLVDDEYIPVGPLMPLIVDRRRRTAVTVIDPDRLRHLGPVADVWAPLGRPAPSS